MRIETARKTIRTVVYHTPLVTSDSVSSGVGRKDNLKLETLQKTGSFKIRGAYYKISKLRSPVNAKGVVAVSAGNHAQAVPLAALLKGKKKSRDPIVSW